MSVSDVVLTEKRARVLLITLNRPEAKNALNQAVVDGVLAAYQQLDDDNGLTVGVFTGAGTMFCAGMDLKEFLKVGPPKNFMDMIDTKRPKKPLIAAVEGHAVAGGLELALACDLIVSADDVRFGIPEVKRGLFAGGGGLTRLPQRLPYSVAMELAITGETLSAQQALDYGLVSKLTPKGGAVDGALELAERVAVNAPLAVAASKELIRRSQGVTEAEFFELQALYVKPVFTSNDAKEGPRAFAEKRTPNWTGT